MKTLLLDIETAPNTAYVWGLFDQNIAHDQVKLSSYVLCWSAVWAGSDKMMFASTVADGQRAMLAKVHALLDAADVVVHYNGQKFDIPTLNKEFLKRRFSPPSPYRQIDLYREVKKSFRFESNKMDSICKALDLGEKVKHQGFELWVGCMEGDAECWRKMEKYNKRDVVLLRELYAVLRPWMPTHPHMGMIAERPEACPVCGVEGKMQARGFVVQTSLRYRRFHCQACGAWRRARKAEKGPAARYV